METELVEEFLKSLAFNAHINLHIKLIHGKNIHHIIEAIFKGVGRAIYKATRINKEIEGVLSTKGSI
jgi:imidazoleglycerol-phosphate dehydratase